MDIRTRFMFYRAKSWSIKHRAILLIKKAWVVHQEKRICNQMQKTLEKMFNVCGLAVPANAEAVAQWHLRDLATALPQCNIHHRITRTENLVTVDYCIEFKKSLNTYNRRNYFLIR